MIEPPTAAPPGPTALPPATLYFSDLCAFRESFLQLVPPPVGGRLLRELGEKISEVALELCYHWRDEMDSSLSGEVRAALGELRHAERLFARIGEEWKASRLEADEILLSQAVEVEARALGEAAGRLEDLLTRHRAARAAADGEGRE